jgi:hypothetical protein
MLGSRWRQRKLSINILPNYSMKLKGVAFAVWAPTPTVLAWLAPSIIGTADAMLCAIITIAAYGKFSCPVLVQVSYSSS